MLQNVSFDETFVPAFVNLSAVTDDIKALCGDNRECIFDVQQTGNTELGEQTKGFEEDNQAAVDELGIKLLQSFYIRTGAAHRKNSAKRFYASHSLNVYKPIMYITNEGKEASNLACTCFCIPNIQVPYAIWP